MSPVHGWHPSSARGTSEMCSGMFCTSGHSSPGQKLAGASAHPTGRTRVVPRPFSKMVPGPQTPTWTRGRAPYNQHYCLPSFLLHGTIKQGTQRLEIKTSTERHVYHSMYYSLVYKVFCLYNSTQVLKYDGKCRKTIQDMSYRSFHFLLSISRKKRNTVQESACKKNPSL